MKLKLISLLLVMAMAFQSISRAENPPVQTQRTHKIVGLAIAAIAIAVIATIFYQLWKLCKKCLGTPPPPPPDQKKGSQNQPGTQFVQIPLTPELSWFNCITNQTTDFLTPDGTNYYTGLMSVNVETSTDMTNWVTCGQITCWISENFLKMQQLDENGNSVSVVTIPNWKTSDPSVLIPSFSANFNPSDQRFFRQTPTY